MKRLDLDMGGVLDFDPEFLAKEEADKLFDYLMKKVDWQQNHYTNYRTGAKLPQPRLTAWYADDPSMSYTYSGVTEKVQPWLPVLLDLKSKIEEITGANYNSVLLNLYRDGRDSVGMHADDEKELGTNANITSLSLGETRAFKMALKEPSPLIVSHELDLPLTHGSLLVMSGTTQEHWKHGIPKQAKITSSRINLTFRKFFKV